MSAQLLNNANAGALKSIKHENLDILLEAGQNEIVAVISDKDTLELRSKMLQFCHLIPSIKPSTKFFDISVGKQKLDKI